MTGGLQRRRPGRPGRRHQPPRPVGVAGQRRRHLPEPGADTWRGPSQTPSWRGTSTATAGTDLAVADSGSNDVSVLLGNGDGTFQNRCVTRRGLAGRHRGGGLQRRRPDRPGRRRLRLQRRVGVAGQRRRHLPGPGDVHGREALRSPSWRGTSTATAGPTWPSPTHASKRRVGVAGQRRRHLPGTGAVRGGVEARCPRGGGLQRRRPDRPGRRQLDANDVSLL